MRGVYFVNFEIATILGINFTKNYTHVQYRSDARYKARVVDTRLPLGQTHLYTEANTCLYMAKWVYTRRQTRLPYTLHLICTVPRVATSLGAIFVEIFISRNSQNIHPSKISKEQCCNNDLHVYNLYVVPKMLNNEMVMAISLSVN